MNKIEIYLNGQYQFSAAAKTAKEVVQRVKDKGMIWYHGINGLVEKPIKPTDRITGRRAGRI